MSELEPFLSKLASFPSTENIDNPYTQDYAVDNLRHYFDYMLKVEGPRLLLIGEAPGHKGCGITGIPFTSGRVFKEVNHPLLRALKNKIQLPKVEAENTATMIWQYLAEKEVTPLFWNAFPFHPHPKGLNNKNRPPSVKEELFGTEFVRDIHNMYKPNLIAGIGQKGTNALKRIFPDQYIHYIRHPSNGGKADFVCGMDDITSKILQLSSR